MKQRSKQCRMTVSASSRASCGYARRRGVIYVGAHQGQEVDQYLAHGCEWIVLIEPNPDACRILRERFKSRVSVVNTNPVLVTSFPL
jgi:hypothetical protein